MQLAEQAPEWEPVQATVKEPLTQTWPILGKAAYHGLAGEIVRAIEPHSEADPAAMLIQFLVTFGNVIGRGNCYVVESTHHYPNLFAVMVGDSAKARKGSSWSRVEALFAPFQDWRKRVQSGLSTGEGLIAAVRDPEIKTKTDKETGEIIEEVIEEGVADKRLLVIEEEYARMLSVMARPGNTLSPIVRNGWDGRDLQTMTKVQPMRATAPHISMVGHSTIDELKRNLTITEAANGFANRFLFACIRRSKQLPFGGQPDDDIMRDLEFKLAERVNAARHLNPSRPPNAVGFDRDGAKLWCEMYGALSAPTPGLLGAIIARGEAQTVRLALLYALLDGADAIGKVHLEAALELWIYLFDLLYLDGEVISTAPLGERKERLRQLLSHTGPPLQFSDHQIGRGPEFYAKVCGLSLEGIISKRADAPYSPGDRGLWVKVKCENRAEFVVVGWTDPEGTRLWLGARKSRSRSPGGGLFAPALAVAKFGSTENRQGSDAPVSGRFCRHRRRRA